jgi:hypothetical protein
VPCLASSVDVVLVEFTTGSQHPDFRHALAQLIDYGSDLRQLSVDDFDRGVVQRFLRSGHAPEHLAGCHDLHDAIERSGWNLDTEAIAALRERLSDVLQAGDFHFVVASPPRRTSTTSRSQTTTDEVAFSASIDDDDYRDAFRDFHAGCSSLGLMLAWGSKGLSIRIQTPDRNLPLSIAWGLPESTGWQGLRYLSAGIDRTSLAESSSVADAAERDIAAVEAIPGGRTPNWSISARTFDASAAPAAVPALINAIAALVEEVQQSA